MAGISGPFNVVCYEDNYFSKRKFKLFIIIVCMNQCTLIFQNVCFLLPICLPCVTCGNVCNETSRQVKRTECP